MAEITRGKFAMTRRGFIRGALVAGMGAALASACKPTAAPAAPNHKM